MHRRPQHEVENRARVVERLRLGGSTGVLAVVCQLRGESRGGNGVGVDDGRATARDQRPYAALGVEDGEFERGARLRVHLGDVRLLFTELAAERRRELHGRAGVDRDFGVLRRCDGDAESRWRTSDRPLDAAFELGCLVELCGEIEEVHVRGRDVLVGDDDERVDFEISELAVDVNGVEARDEVDEDVVHALGDLFEEARGDLLVAGVLPQVDGDEHLLGFGVDVADVDAAFVVEEDPVALECRR